MKRVLVFAAAVLFVIAGAQSASATTITFNEGLAPPGSQLEGTGFYTPLGLTFEDSVIFGPDGRLPDDGHGIFNSPNSTGVVHFLTPVTNVSFTWATAGAGQSFFANAYNELNQLVGTFSFNGAGAPGSSNGVAGFGSQVISRLEYHDSGATVAIDTLNFTAVPEPATLALFGTGLAAIVRRRMRRK